MSSVLKLATGLICLLLVTLCQAGSLNPPAAPTAGTMRPLDQVEPRIPITSVPYTILQSGSYYLAKNLTSTTDGIRIFVDDVTMDLCGFTLTGPGTSGSHIGVAMNGRKNIEIRNGTIQKFGYTGIIDYDSGGSNRRIIGVQVVGCGNNGIQLAGNDASVGDLVKDCVVSGNSSSYSGEACGIYVNSNAVVAGNSVYGTGNSLTSTCYGIRCSEKCTITNNKVYYNGASATGTVYGIYTASGSIISGNAVYNNGKSASTVACGISAGTGSIITGNAVRSNYGYGIQTTTACRIADNTITENRTQGISSGDSCTIHSNVVSLNALGGIATGNNSIISRNTVTSNSIVGINASDRVSITDNTVSSNGSSGILCTGGTIAKNTVTLNNSLNLAGQGGIVVSYRSQIKENTLEGNLKNNIYVVGYRNCIEGNVMSGSDYGINFGSTGNVYINNRATCNGTNYNAAGNTDGGGNISF